MRLDSDPTRRGDRPTPAVVAVRLALCLVAVATAMVGGSSVASAQGAAEVELARVDLDQFPEVTFEVSVPASFTGGAIDPAQVALLENGTPVAFELSPVPADGLEIVLLIDTSGSMAENRALESAKEAAGAFLAELPPEVQVGVVAFADTPTLVSPLTTDRPALVAAIGRLQPNGRTSLYDGIVFADTLFSGATPDRQLVTLSDGGDTASNTTLDDAVAVSGAVRTNAIEIVTSESNAEALALIAAAGNGRLTSIADPGALGALYQEVARSLVNRYRLTFTSQAGGTTEYTLTVDTFAGPLTASATVELPERAAPTTPAPTTTTTVPAVVAATGSTTPTTTAPAANVAVPNTGDGDGSTGSVWVLVIGAAAVGLSITALLVIAATGDQRKLGRRQLGLPKRRAKQTSSTGIGERVTAIADDVIDRSGRRTGLAQALDVADVAMRPAEFVVVTLCGAIAVGSFTWLISGPILGLLGMVATVLVARSVLSIRAERRRKAFDAQLPDVLQLITNALRSGFALPQALDAVANQAAEPARSEFERVNFETRVGLDPGESLNALADRMKSPNFRWVVAAFEINREVGGELAKVLSALADTIRERHALDRQVRTLTAEGRISAYILTGLPVVMALLIALISPEYFEPMTSPPGPQILLGSAAILGVGWFWMRSMVKTEL